MTIRLVPPGPVPEPEDQTARSPADLAADEALADLDGEIFLAIERAKGRGLKPHDVLLSLAGKMGEVIAQAGEVNARSSYALWEVEALRAHRAEAKRLTREHIARQAAAASPIAPGRRRRRRAPR